MAGLGKGLQVKKLAPKHWPGWLATAPGRHKASAQMQIGDNTHMNAGGLFTVGYAGDYGNQIPVQPRAELRRQTARSTVLTTIPTF